LLEQNTKQNTKRRLSACAAAPASESGLPSPLRSAQSALLHQPAHHVRVRDREHLYPFLGLKKEYPLSEGADLEGANVNSSLQRRSAKLDPQAALVIA
jgi:hypothetical protein